MVIPAPHLVHPYPEPEAEAGTETETEEDEETSYEYDIYKKKMSAAAAAADDYEYLVIGTHNHKMLVKKESLRNERQISVDPISIKESTNHAVVTVPKVNNNATTTATIPMLPPAKPKFLSSSLPSSASSSPRFSSNLLKKKKPNKYSKNQNQAASSLLAVSSLARQHSVVLSKPATPHQESQFRRSKSCGEGRASAPPDDFDLWLSKVDDYNRYTGHDDRSMHLSSFSKLESRLEGLSHTNGMSRMVDPSNDKFKCCLFLPTFGKGKPVRPPPPPPRREEAEIMGQYVVSRTVSLEKFECGSWTSSAIMNDNGDDDDDGNSANLFFDLPLELIRTSVNDAHSPVKAAFLFDKDVKGVLKNGGSGASSSRAAATGCSNRHVRFSTSSPRSNPTSPSASCITPRLRKAREDFNAFLEAQSA